MDKATFNDHFELPLLGDNNNEAQITELAELQLAFVGGGIGDIIVA